MDNRTFDNFDAFASDYRAIHSKNVQLSGADSFYWARMKVDLLKQYEQNEQLQVLDVGCGDGATELFMHRFFSQWQITGIDVSEQSINEAKQKNIPGTTFQSYNGRQLPFADASVDVVFVAGVLHHVSFDLHVALLKEVYRVLKTGGRFYLFEHNPLNPLTRYLVKTCIFDKDAQLLKRSYTAKQLSQAGFSNRRCRFIIFFPRKGLLSRFIPLEKYFTQIPLGGQYYYRCIK